jgi:undecaprenyl-diphosphatase
MTLGLIASALAAGLVIKGFLRWVAKVGMMPFVVYRLLLAGLLFTLLALGLA